jgi:hypothetical protein
MRSWLTGGIRMRLILPIVVVCGAVAVSPAFAAVEMAAPDGFVVRHEITVPVDDKRAFDELVHPQRWWSDAHTWSGSAANLSLDAKAGGCWCERWANGEAQHGVVVRVLADDSLRVSAAFGPLQEMALTGVFDVVLHPAANGVRIEVTYKVVGPASAQLDQLAAPVDGVIGEQVQRLKARLEAPAE